MKRAFAALGAFVTIGFGVLLGAAPATAASCIQSTAGCAPAYSADIMPYNGPDMFHN